MNSNSQNVAVAIFWTIGRYIKLRDLICLLRLIILISDLDDGIDLWLQTSVNNTSWAVLQALWRQGFEQKYNVDESQQEPQNSKKKFNKDKNKNKVLRFEQKT